MDNKVSEKAIWEGSITPDEAPITASQMQSQPQMMFCYKCNQVIPENSIFCPYCQVKLFTECPKCGFKYSSQYPSCSQCGTNREEYLRVQRREQERKAAIERENRRQREIAEQKRLEEERRRKVAEEERDRKKRIEAYEKEKREKTYKEAYKVENEKIKTYDEYRTTYSLLSKAIEAYNKKSNNTMNGIVLFMFSLILMVVIPPVGAITFIISLFIIFTGTRSKEEEYIRKYIQKKNDFDKEMMDRAINIVMKYGQYSLSDCCIIAYREKHNLPINYEWHNNDNVK